MSRNREYQKLLNSKRWKLLRAEYLRAHPLCEDCKAQGFIVAAVDVHHIVPVESAKSPAEMEALCFNVHGNNLRALCIPCHIRVHQEARSHSKEGHKQREDDQVCATRYPILMVHGVFFRDFKYFNYWGRIPEELEANGATIFYGNQPSADAVADEISASLQALMGPTDEPAPKAPAQHPQVETTTSKFANLKFGPNYDPTESK